MCGEGGLDEVALSGPTRVAQLERGNLNVIEVTPADFGLPQSPIESLKVGDVAESAAVIRAVFAGEKGPRRDAVVINAAAGLYVAGHVGSYREATSAAAEAIDTGAAQRKLEAWGQLSKGN